MDPQRGIKQGHEYLGAKNTGGHVRGYNAQLRNYSLYIPGRKPFPQIPQASQKYDAGAVKHHLYTCSYQPHEEGGRHDCMELDFGGGKKAQQTIHWTKII